METIAGSDASDQEVASLEAQRHALSEKVSRRTSGKYARVLLAALSGLPWVGILLSMASTYTSETEAEQQSELHRLWIQEHEGKLQHLGETLTEIMGRFDDFGDELQERIQSEEYLGLVRRAFRSWDQADTQQKREFVKRLLATPEAPSSAQTILCAFSSCGSIPTMSHISQSSRKYIGIQRLRAVRFGAQSTAGRFERTRLRLIFSNFSYET